MNASSRVTLRLGTRHCLGLILLSGFLHALHGGSPQPTGYLPLVMDVVQGQILQALIGQEGDAALLWIVTDQGERHCLELKGPDILTYQVIHTGRLRLELERATTDRSEPAWIDGLIATPEDALTQPNGWHAAFCALESWLQDPRSGEPTQLAARFSALGCYREANTCALLVAERLWETKQRNQARDLLLAQLAQPWSELDLSLAGKLNHRLGEMESLLGYLSDAATHLERAANLRHRLNQPKAEAAAHYALGNVYTITGDLDLAEAAYNQTLVLCGSDSPLARYTLLELGWLARRRNNYPAAIAIFNDLIQRAERVGDIYLQMETHDRLGSTLGLAGRFAEGERALIISGQLIDRYDGDRQTLHAINALNLAFLYRAWHRLDAALAFADKALALYSKDTYQEGKVTIYWTKGCVLRDLGREIEALDQFDLCLSEAEAIRARSGFGQQGIEFFQTSFENLEDIFHLCWQLHQKFPQAGYSQRAFLFLERLRARGLSDVLAMPKAPVKAGNPPLTRLIPPAERGQDRPPRVDLRNLASADLLIAQIRQHLLRQDRGMLAYFLGERRSYWFLLTQNRLEMGTMPARSALEQLVESFLVSLRKVGPLAAQQQDVLATSLAEHLLPQPQIIAKLDHLYLLADGQLNRLPFGLLPLRSKGSAIPQRLFQQKSLTFLPSASLGLALRKRPSSATDQSKVLAFVDPAFKNDKIQHRYLPLNIFPRLVCSGQELEILEKCFGRGNVQSYRGFQATRQQFLAQDLERFQLIHLATHALCIPEQPGCSGLVFALFSETAEQEEPYLSSETIRHLKLRAKLVVLSACSGADGPLFRGEGLMGLARAFIEAGAGAVLASLWDADDEATAVLMRHFYKALRKGEESAEALQIAKRKMASSHRWSAPRFWAGFCLIGDSHSFFLNAKQPFRPKGVYKGM